MGFWDTATSGLVLNLTSSLLWDSGKSFMAAVRRRRQTSAALEQISAAVFAHAGVSLPVATLTHWLDDETFWICAAEVQAADDGEKHALAARVEEFCGTQMDPEAGARALATVLFEIGRHDPILADRLTQARLDHRLNVLEHSLGYVLEEVLGAIFDLSRQMEAEPNARKQDLHETATIPKLERRSRCTVPPPSPSSIRREPVLADLIAKLTQPSGRVALMSMKGAGGVGKTVLARQLGVDQAVAAAFAGGVFWQAVGEYPDKGRREEHIEAIAEQLYRQLSNGQRPTLAGSATSQLQAVYPDQPALLIFDDVWAPTEPFELLLATVPPHISVLITTRGARISGSQAVEVSMLSPDESRAILNGDSNACPSALAAALDALGDVLGRWALLVDMASRLLMDARHNPVELAAQADAIAQLFGEDPTVLDDPDSRERSLARIMDRSLDTLATLDRSRFGELSIYPPDAKLEFSLISDLWLTNAVQTTRTIHVLERVGLLTVYPASPSQQAYVELHDLIVALLNNPRTGYGVTDSRLRERLHSRCLIDSVTAGGLPGELTEARARWLTYHLVRTNDWNRLSRIAERPWRTALLKVTGSDATFIASMAEYAEATEKLNANDHCYHLTRSVLATAHVYEIIANTPVAALVAQALLGDPSAAMAQAMHHPEAAAALPRLAQAVPQLTGSAMEAALHLRDDQRSLALAGMAEVLVAMDHERAIEAAMAVPDDLLRLRAMLRVAQRLEVSSTERALLLYAELVGAAAALSDDEASSDVLASVAWRLSNLDVEWAIAAAAAVPNTARRSEVLARISARLSGILPDSAEQAVLLIPDVHVRSQTLANLGLSLVNRDAERAIGVAGAIPDEAKRSEALARISASLSGANAALATKAALLISNSQRRCDALISLAKDLRAVDPDRGLELYERSLDAAAGSSEHSKDHALVAIVEGLSYYQMWVGETHRSDSHRGWTRDKDTRAILRLRTVSLINRSLEMASSMADEGNRCGTLSRIALVLAEADPAQSAMLFRQAVETAKSIREEDARSRALSRIALVLAEADPAQSVMLFRQAVETAKSIPEATTRYSAVANIAQMLAVVDPMRAAALIEGIAPEQLRTKALVAIVRQIAILKPALAVAVAHKIERDSARFEVLALAATQLASTDAPRAIEVALSLPDWGNVQSNLFISIVRTLAKSNPWEAGRVADTIRDPAQRGMAVQVVVRSLAALDPEGALRLASSVAGSPSHDEALVCIALALASVSPQRSVAILLSVALGAERDRALADIAFGSVDSDAECALSAALSITDTDSRDKVLSFIAQCLAWSDQERAIAAAEAISNARVCCDILLWLSKWPSIGDALLDRSITVAERIQDAHSRSEALASIAEEVALTAPGRARAICETLVEGSATLRPDDERRWPALVAIAENTGDLQHDAAAVLYTYALDAARSLGAAESRGIALSHIASNVSSSDPTLSSELFDEALALASSTAGLQAEARILRTVVEHMAASDPARALRVARSIREEWAQSQALMALVGRVAASDRTLAEHEALRIPDLRYRCEALTILASQVSPADGERRLQMCYLALDAAGLIPDHAMRGRIEALIAGELAVCDPDRAIDIASTCADDWARGNSFANIAIQLADTETEHAVDLGLKITDAETRSRLFLKLSERAGDLGARESARLHDLGVAAALAIRDDERAAQALAALAAQCAGRDPSRAQELYSLALERGESVADPIGRCLSLVGIARRLRHLDQERAVSLYQCAAAVSDSSSVHGYGAALAIVALELEPLDIERACSLFRLAISTARVSLTATLEVVAAIGRANSGLPESQLADVAIRAATDALRAWHE